MAGNLPIISLTIELNKEMKSGSCSGREDERDRYLEIGSVSVDTILKDAQQFVKSYRPKYFNIVEYEMQVWTSQAQKY